MRGTDSFVFPFFPKSFHSIDFYLFHFSHPFICIKHRANLLWHAIYHSFLDVSFRITGLYQVVYIKLGLFVISCVFSLVILVFI